MQAPIEVCEAVIDEASDNPASLRLLSLTCSAFLPRARYHLFSRIVIRSVQQMDASCQLFDSRPWLRTLVQKVTLFVLVPVDNTLPNVRLLDVVPIHLLSSLPNLRSWTMEVPRHECTQSIQPCVFLHRSTLWRYQKYGGRIQNLELINIFMEDISDFMGLLSAFGGVRTLKCSRINYRRERDLSSLDNLRSRTNTLNRPLTIENLIAGPHLDMVTTEYLVASSAATLNHLVITIQSPERIFCHPNYPVLWEVSMSQISHLSSLVLEISAHDEGFSPHWEWANDNSSTPYDMRLATRILKCLKRDHLGDVRVQLELEPVAAFGRWLSLGNPSFEVCKALEEELLTFPSCGMTVYDAKVVRRSGRTEFWSPVIHAAFPKLNERGLFTFTRTQTNIRDPFGHEGAVICLAASADNKRIVTASTDGTIIVWDTKRGTPIHEWFVTAPVSALALSPDGERLLSVPVILDRGDPLIIWDIGDSNVGARRVAELEIEGHTECICCTWSSDGAFIALAFIDGTARAWDAQTFQWRSGQMNRSPGETGIFQCKFCPNSRYLAWISPTICYVSQPFAEESPVIHLEPANPERYVSVNAFSFDPNSTRIATAHGNGIEHSLPEECVVRIWDVASGTLLLVLGAPAHAHFIRNVSFAPDGNSVLSASVDGSVKIWDAESGAQIFSLDTLESGRGMLYMTFFSPDGNYIAIVSEGYKPHDLSGMVRLWRTSDASCVAECTEQTSQVLHVAFSPNGEVLATVDTRGVVHIRRVSNLFMGN